VDDPLLTGPHGRQIDDLFYREAGAGERDLDDAVDAIESGSTDRGGTLLSSYNVRFVVVERDRSEPWVSQRDFAVARDEPEYLLLESSTYLPRAAVFRTLPPALGRQVLGDTDGDSLLAQADQLTSYRYSARVSGGGVALLAESSDPGWEAGVDEAGLERREAGWANAFSIPDDLEGRLLISFPRSLEWYLRMVGVALAWVVVLGAAVSRRRVHAERKRP
jgi:hypothetical protein